MKESIEADSIQFPTIAFAAVTESRKFNSGVILQGILPLCRRHPNQTGIECTFAHMLAFTLLSYQCNPICVYIYKYARQTSVELILAFTETLNNSIKYSKEINIKNMHLMWHIPPTHTDIYLHQLRYPLSVSQCGCQTTILGPHKKRLFFTLHDSLCVWTHAHTKARKLRPHPKHQSDLPLKHLNDFPLKPQ